MPNCEVCGVLFTVEEWEDFPEEVDVCYSCQLESLPDEAFQGASPETIQRLRDVAGDETAGRILASLKNARQALRSNK